MFLIVCFDGHTENDSGRRLTIQRQQRMSQSLNAGDGSKRNTGTYNGRGMLDCSASWPNIRSFCILRCIQRLGRSANGILITLTNKYWVNLIALSRTLIGKIVDLIHKSVDRRASMEAFRLDVHIVHLYFLKDVWVGVLVSTCIYYAYFFLVKADMHRGSK